MDKYIGKNNCIICVEPNARIYGGEYYYSLDEIVADIQNFKNIKTMIDTGNLSAECIDPISEFTKYHEFIHHIHISSPDLQPIVDYKSYKNFILNIKNSEYNKNITYEYMNSRNINKEITEFINLFKM
jgi:sugar phosphate isomerase/epimerase